MRYVCLVWIMLTSLVVRPVSAQDAGWHVAGSEELDPARELLLLSPDGTMIFEANLSEPDEICVREIASDEVRCDDGTAAMIARNSVTWAPDSSAIAFSTDWVQSGIDSDVQIFDATTGTAENLTDDGVEEYQDGADRFQRDVFPSWTPDSQFLLFQRMGQEYADYPIMRISREGGEPEVYATFPDDVAPVLNAPIHLLDGDSFLFNTIPNPREPALRHGVFRMNPDGAVDLLVPGPEAPGPATVLLDVSPDGTTIMVAQPLLTRSEPGAPFVFLVDTASGTSLPIEGDYDVAPVFLADGSSVLTATREDDNSMTLAILSPDGTSTDLYTMPPEENPEPGLAAGTMVPTLTWADSNIILAHMYTGTVLLEVEPGMSPASPVSTPGTPTPERTSRPVRSTSAPLPTVVEELGEPPYRVLRPTEIEPGGELARLSPDGSQVAVLTSDGSTELCIREIESFEEICAEIGITSRDLQTIRWSPDSSVLVFTSEPILTGVDTDIWMMDAVTGGVTNLTDDDTDILAEPGSAMDVHPGWSPDGDIIFQRYDREDDSEVRVSLMRISPDGGEAEEIAHFPREYATVMSGPAFPLADGSVILATMPATGFTTGLFRVASDGTFEHLGDDSLVPTQDSLVVLDVTADGSRAIVYGRTGYELRFHDGAIGLLDLETGELTRPESLVGEPPAPATFSPDDTEMLSVVTGDDETLTLMLTDLVSGEISELHRVEPFSGEGEAMWPLISLVWAENDTVLLHTGTPTSVLVPLAR